jgi:hypothetical protein
MANILTRRFSNKDYNGFTPNICPICHNKISIENSLNTFFSKEYIQELFVCPDNDCKRVFIGYYRIEEPNKLNLLFLLPDKIEAPKFDPIINDISPKFISIYLEAEEARQKNLFQISGPGFRKAFEFLIKDYAKKISSPDKHNEIENIFSGLVVSKFIDDKRIQEVAKRALWLGNDETHYLRIWQDHDIDDLIILIRLTISWIEIEQISKKYTVTMPDK